ncbi:hypothetical protein [Gordonia sp. (in: high G+C Gram-positive bacteria)]|uniref:hypothetical protein n=1 Tax=Gordonia sp. (in: high G+C Gram-positive bacteria) TaxID=84139 RepID=UPI003C70DA12
MNARITRTAITGIGALSVIGALAVPGIAAAAPTQQQPTQQQPANQHGAHHHKGHKHADSMLMIDGDLTLAPGVHVLNISAHGHKDKHGKTHGSYVATVMDGKHKTPYQVKGPVTCIYTHGDTAALVYPITGTTPELVPPSARGKLAVKISVRKGKVDHVGVQGPMPTNDFHGCLPGATPNTFTGKITIR